VETTALNERSIEADATDLLEGGGSENMMLMGALAASVRDRFIVAKNGRAEVEERLLTAYRNFRGEYTAFTDDETSKVFVKVTKTKALAAFGIIHEILYPGKDHKFPLEVNHTPKPDGVEESVNIDPKAPPQEAEEEAAESPYGFKGDGKDLQPGDTHNTLMDRLGAFTKKLAGITGLKSGEGNTPTAITIHPAAVSAHKMNKKMQDQLLEGGAHAALEASVLELCILGTGIITGPFSVKKEYPKWLPSEKVGMPRRYAPEKRDIPTWENISIWDFYPDPDAHNKSDMEYFIRRRRWGKSKLYSLLSRVGFDKERIDEAVSLGANYTPEVWESDLEDTDTGGNPDRYEVLEYWGLVHREDLEADGIDVPSEFDDVDIIQMNIWTCNDVTIRALINPFRPQGLPCYIGYYEVNPYSFFGVGVAENMADSQLIMNGFMRMAIDNAALSGNLIFEIDEDALTPGQDLKVVAGKVFKRQSGAPGQALFSTKFQNVTQENMMVFDKARMLADESTGLPSFAHGQTGVTGVGRTASGISMLMGAAHISIKTVVSNIDNMLADLGQSLFSWNMQYEPDDDIVGDLNIKARGTDALMAKEVRSQRLMAFMQVASNPAFAAFIKIPYILREIAASLDLDPEKVTNNMEEAALQAIMLQQQGGGGPAPGAGAPPGANPSDSTGGGGSQIGIGVPQTPGSEGFTGTPQMSGPQPNG
jgi:hypothetical protein